MSVLRRVLLALRTPPPDLPAAVARCAAALDGLEREASRLRLLAALLNPS